MSDDARPQFDQQLLAGMPEPLYPCTPTRLVTWRDCPRRYRFSYLDRPQPPKGAPWAHNSVGAAVHSALADWWRLAPEQRTPDAGVARLSRRWLTDGFESSGQSAEVEVRAAGWVRTYLSGVDPELAPVGIERTVTARTRTLALSGRADRIDFDGQRLVIVDYKTGRHVPDPEDARSSMALAVYAVAAQRTLRHPCRRVELHHLPSKTVAVMEYPPAELDAKIAEAESIGAQCARADERHQAGDTGDAAFPPRPASRCSWCDYRRHCPEGRAAAPERRPWDGVTDL